MSFIFRENNTTKIVNKKFIFNFILREKCRKATTEEYQDLFNELTNNVGYNLNIL